MEAITDESFMAYEFAGKLWEFRIKSFQISSFLLNLFIQQQSNY